MAVIFVFSDVVFLHIHYFNISFSFILQHGSSSPAANIEIISNTCELSVNGVTLNMHFHDYVPVWL